MSTGGTLFPAVKPFLLIAGVFVGLGALVAGLVVEFVPTCIVGHSTDGLPIIVRCDSPFAISLVAVGITVMMVSIFAWRFTYSRRKVTTPKEAPN